MFGVTYLNLEDKFVYRSELNLTKLGHQWASLVGENIMLMIKKNETFKVVFSPHLSLVV